MEKQIITKDDIGTLDLSKPTKVLHLDSEYRRRYQEYHLADGTVKDSREINWRQVDWEKVVKIITYMNGNKHVSKCNDPYFKFFMCFRWGGREAQYNAKKEYIGHTKINLWTTGWTDGKTCFLMDIDFYTGKCVKEYKAPLKMFKSHIHPRVKSLV